MIPAVALVVVLAWVLAVVLTVFASSTSSDGSSSGIISTSRRSSSSTSSSNIETTICVDCLLTQRKNGAVSSAQTIETCPRRAHQTSAIYSRCKFQCRTHRQPASAFMRRAQPKQCKATPRLRALQAMRTGAASGPGAHHDAWSLDAVVHWSEAWGRLVPAKLPTAHTGR